MIPESKAHAIDYSGYYMGIHFEETVESCGISVIVTRKGLNSCTIRGPMIHYTDVNIMPYYDLQLQHMYDQLTNYFGILIGL